MSPKQLILQETKEYDNKRTSLGKVEGREGMIILTVNVEDEGQQQNVHGPTGRSIPS